MNYLIILSLSILPSIFFGSATRSLETFFSITNIFLLIPILQKFIRIRYVNGINLKEFRSLTILVLIFVSIRLLIDIIRIINYGGSYNSNTNTLDYVAFQQFLPTTFNRVETIFGLLTYLGHIVFGVYVILALCFRKNKYKHWEFCNSESVIELILRLIQIFILIFVLFCILDRIIDFNLIDLNQNRNFGKGTDRGLGLFAYRGNSVTICLIGFAQACINLRYHLRNSCVKTNTYPNNRKIKFLDLISLFAAFLSICVSESRGGQLIMIITFLLIFHKKVIKPISIILSLVVLLLLSQFKFFDRISGQIKNIFNDAVLIGINKNLHSNKITIKWLAKESSDDEILSLRLWDNASAHKASNVLAVKILGSGSEISQNNQKTIIDHEFNRKLVDLLKKTKEMSVEVTSESVIISVGELFYKNIKTIKELGKINYFRSLSIDNISKFQNIKVYSNNIKSPLTFNIPNLTDKFIGKRTAIYNICFQIIDEFPIFGTGQGTFSSVCLFYRKVGEPRHAFAHCDPLEFTCENGLLMFVFVAAIVIYGLRKFKNTLLGQNNRLIDCVKWMVVVIVLHSSIDFPFQLFALSQLFISLFSILVALVIKNIYGLKVKMEEI